MANMPRNLYLQDITGNTLTTILTPDDGETYTNLWAVVFNNHSSPITITVSHNNGSTDVPIIKKTIQSGKPETLPALAGVKVNPTQLLKIQSSDATGQYYVDLSGSVVTQDT